MQGRHGRNTFPAVWSGLGDTRAFKGNISINTFVDQDNSDRIILWEKETRENYESYLAWRTETGMFEGLEPFSNGTSTIHPPLSQGINLYNLCIINFCRLSACLVSLQNTNAVESLYGTQQHPGS